MFVFLFFSAYSGPKLSLCHLQIQAITLSIDIPYSTLYLLRFHLSHFLSSVQWWDNLYVRNKVYATIHHSTTWQSLTNTQSNGRRSISLSASVLLLSTAHFSYAVYGRWILKRKQGCDVEKTRRSQSPPQRQQVPQQTRQATETWTLLIDAANRGKEFQMGGITGSIVWLAETL